MRFVAAIAELLSLGHMTSPQQFLESFLREKTAASAEARPYLNAVYSRYFGEPLSQHAEQFMPRAVVRAEVETVRHSDSTASVVTREHFATADLRTRYRLAASGESWKIIGIDRECFICRGASDSQCHKCAGEGWYDCTTNVA